MKTLYVIDACNYIFRSYFGIRRMTNQEGASTNALFGFIRSIQKLMKDFSPDHMVCVFDGPNNKESRIAIYPEYKGHRDECPEDLIPQIGLAKEFCQLYGIPFLEVSGVEADDAMGTVAKWAAKKGTHVFLCSSDKDLCQLVSKEVKILNTFKENLVIDEKKVEEIHGIRPEQMIDYLAIVGDTSDNIPGIKGFGPKTAQDLLKKFGTLDQLLAHPEKLENKKREEKIALEKDNALISRTLATIDINVDVPLDPSFYTLEEPNKKNLVSFYEKMSFSSLLKELGEVKTTTKKTTTQIIATEKGLKDLLATLSSEDEICIDVETTSLNPMQAKIVGFGLATQEGTSFYIPLNGALEKTTALLLLKPFLEKEGRSFIGHNIKYDMHAMANEGIGPIWVRFDTLIASYLIGSKTNRHDLGRLAEEHFSITMTPISDLIGEKKKEQISMLDVPIEKVASYCGEDVDVTLKLKNLFEKTLEQRGLSSLFYEIENPLVAVLFAMEAQGIYLDVTILEEQAKEILIKLQELEKEIHNIAETSFNINSPKQLSETLFTHLQIPPIGKKKQSGYSTSADILEELKDKHPIIEKILSYRSLEKLRSTYIDALPEQINPKTGRIHSSFNQSVTATGRLSSTNPNLQNIPIRSTEGRKIRNAFRPQKEGWSFISADYSQIELRILAHFSEEPNLISAFQNDEDIHLFTASKVFDLPLEEVTKEMRFRAKAVNFGIIYGQQAYGLARELQISVSEANEFIKMYFTRYPKVKEFIDKCKKDAIDGGKVTTLMGRERLLPEANSKNGIERAQALRFAVNSPIQGTQADIIKMAMIDIHHKIFKSKLKGFMVLQIHDELIFEVPDNEIPDVQKIITDIMENIVSLKVPLKVDISIGKNWGEC